MTETNGNAQAPAPSAGITIEFTGEMMEVKIPLVTGKLGVYGGLEIAKEQAAKYFYVQEKKQQHIQNTVAERFQNILRRK